jgi:hypothetical protein
MELSFSSSMSVIADQYALARRKSLARLRECWGRERTGPQPEEKKRSELAESIASRFLELSDQDLELASRVPTASHLRNLAEELRAIRAEKYAVLQEPTSDDVSGGAGSKRRELLTEIASEHFHTGMQSWLTSVAVDHGLSSTPVVELEQVHSEMRYRLKLLQAMVTMTEREIDALEVQIKGKRVLEAGGS